MQRRKKFTRAPFLVVALALGLSLLAEYPIIAQGSASTFLVMHSWVHTSDGMGEGTPPSFPDTYAIAFSPHYAIDSTVYAGTYIGVFRSTDKGLTWTNKTPSLPAINSLSVCPADATGNTLIAGTEDGIIQTTNRWDSAYGIGPNSLSISFAVYSPDYAHDHMIFAGTDGNGVYAMTDTLPWWSIDENTVTGKITGIVFDPNFAVNHIFFVASYGAGVYKGDGGPNLVSFGWTAMNTGLDTDNKKHVSAIAISPNFAVDHTLFIASDGVGIYKSTDAGQHWNVAHDNDAFQTLLFSPDYATDRSIFAGESNDGVYRSTDRGVTWSQMNRGFADPVHAGCVLSLAFAPGKPTNLFAGLCGGLNGGVWQFLFPSSQIFIPIVVK